MRAPRLGTIYPLQALRFFKGLQSLQSPFCPVPYLNQNVQLTCLALAVGGRENSKGGFNELGTLAYTLCHISTSGVATTATHPMGDQSANGGCSSAGITKGKVSSVLRLGERIEGHIVHAQLPLSSLSLSSEWPCACSAPRRHPAPSTHSASSSGSSPCTIPILPLYHTNQATNLYEGARSKVLLEN